MRERQRETERERKKKVQFAIARRISEREGKRMGELKLKKVDGNNFV